MKIDFLIAVNPYSTTAHFSEKLALALKRKGCTVRTFYIGGGLFYKAFYEIMADRPDLTCSFSDITIGQKEPLADMWGIPHLNILVDHAIYFLHQIKSKYNLFASMDEEDVLYLKGLGAEAFSFLHGIDRDLVVDPTQKRAHEIVMFGTCFDFEKIVKKWENTPFLDCAEKVLQSEDVSVLRALIESKVEDNLALMHQDLEKYCKGKERVELINSLEGVEVWGNGPWKKYCPKARIHKSIGYEKALQIMASSKIVINSAICHKFSSHERIFQPLALGALPLTSATTFARRNFCDGKNILIAGDHVEKVKELLHNDDLRVQIALEGQKEVLQKHTWDERANRLVEALMFV